MSFASKGRVAPLPISPPDPAEAGVLEALSYWAWPSNENSAQQLVPEAEWPLLKAVWRIEPGLVWLAWWSGKFNASAADTSRPIRELRRRLAAAGVCRSSWRRLLGEANTAALSLYKRRGSKALESHVRLEALLGIPLPYSGAAGEWVRSFVWESAPTPHFWRQGSDAQLAPTHAQRLVVEGLSRLKQGNFDCFRRNELRLVLRYWTAIVRDRLARWSTLVARAIAAHENELQPRLGQRCHWDSGMIDIKFAGFRITALSNNYALWREGQAMRHCIGGDAKYCAEGRRVFHLQADDTHDSWTLALAPDGNTAWQVHEICGERNRPPTPKVLEVAAAWANAYAGIFHPHVGGRALDYEVEEDWYEVEEAWYEDGDEDDREESLLCSVCGAENCETHLLAEIQYDHKVVGGRLQYMWEARVNELQRMLNKWIVTERADSRWPAEIYEIYAAIVWRSYDLLGSDASDNDRLVSDELFAEAWIDIGADETLIIYLTEWIDAQPGTHKSYDFGAAPDLIGFNSTCHALDVESIVIKFVNEFFFWGLKTEPDEAPE